uniref:Uncharacterized protein n=1 Tax=Chenopodium quinoa TaxID=63459 RepID=A0A803M5A2_CHEQI
MEEVQGYLSEIGLSVSVSPEKGRFLFTARNFSPVLPAGINYSNPKLPFYTLSWECRNRIGCSIVLNARHSKLEKERLKYLTPSIRLMVKLYLRRKPQDEKVEYLAYLQVIPTTVTDNYNLMEALVSHMTEIDDEQPVLYAQMANLVSVILQWPGLKLKEVAENFSKCLDFQPLCSQYMQKLWLFNGISLILVLPKAHLKINLICLPNAVLMFEGKQAVVRAVQPIPKGAMRRYSRKFYIGRKQGIHLPTMGHARKLEDLRKIASEVNTFSEKAEDSLKSGKAYPGCHPMLGLQYYTCGKLEWLLGETANCVRSLTKALDILRLTHGTNTPFMKELLFKLEEALAEASFKLKPLDED